MIPVFDDETKKALSDVSEIIKSEVNVKEISLVDDSALQLIKRIKPNFKLLGARLGAKMKIAAQLITAFNQDDIKKIEKEGEYMLDIEGEKFDLKLTEVEIFSEDIPGWQVASDNGLTVALDINISKDLRNEGLARELINRLQNQRKDRNFEVTDKIIVHIKNNELLNPAIQQYSDYICNEILADQLLLVDSLEDGIEIEVDEIKTFIAIELNHN
jgi:isoleucyl-tRNA synthetase